MSLKIWTQFIRNFLRNIQIIRDSHKKSYTTNFANNNIEIFLNSIKLPKIKQIKAKIRKKFTEKIKFSTVSQTPSEKYYIPVLVITEYTILSQADKKVGMNLGLKDLCITCNGKKYKNPKTLYKCEKKLAKTQRCT